MPVERLDIDNGSELTPAADWTPGSALKLLRRLPVKGGPRRERVVARRGERDPQRQQALRRESQRDVPEFEEAA